MKKVSVIFGTRPEAIKLCLLILEMQKHPQLDQVMETFDVKPHYDLNLMLSNQALSGIRFLIKPKT